MKKVEKDELEEKLDFLGLKLDKLPKFIKDSTVPPFNLSRLNNDKDLRIYKFVPIDKIEILLTPCLRSDNLKKKYSEAVPLKEYLNNDGDEEELMLYKTFSKIVKNTSYEEIEKVEKIQENFAGEVPFKVKYNRDHLWQIYYSEAEDRYFMLVCTKEEIFPEFMYLLKEKIAASKKRKKEDHFIYVPINYISYSEQILEKSEITDIENYLWLFTKNWPLIFEVYDSENNLSLHVVGDTFVYKNIKSSYKMILKTEEEALKFYKLLKALFILQTEIKGQYCFDTKIDSGNGINFYLAKVEITFDTLTNFIKNEFLLANYEIDNKNNEILEAQKRLFELKQSVKVKEDEYLQKQKEISTYLECKKTFIGKVKYFFKSEKKDKKKRQNQKVDDIAEIKNAKIDTKPLETYIGNKEFYTIEDLVTIYSLHEKSEKNFKGVKQDIKALELKLENLISKVRNANQYIEEIDKHKKSIFEFWKFANKDEKLALEMAGENDEDKDKNDIKKSFDFEMDFEKLGISADEIQRKKLSHEEIDSIFIAQTELLDSINMVRSNNMVKYSLERALENLKQEFNDNRLVIDSETFDIFGNIADSNTKIKYIGSKSHRETEKSKFKIMNINKKIDIFDFTEKMQSIVNYLEGAMPKIKSLYNMSIYKLVPISNTIENEKFEMFDIDIENELKEHRNDVEGAYNLICLNYKEDLPIIYFSNIMFFDNNNKTLPTGMDMSSKVLIDTRRLKFSLVNKTKFRTNTYFYEEEENNYSRAKEVFVYEYDVSLKDENDEDDNVAENLLTDFNNVVSTMNAFEDIINDENSDNDGYTECSENYDQYVDNSEEVEEYQDYEDDTNYSDEFNKDMEIHYNQDVQEDIIEDVMQEVVQEVPKERSKEPKKSKKLLKMEQKYEKELEKQKKKEQKAREKLEKLEKKIKK